MYLVYYLYVGKSATRSLKFRQLGSFGACLAGVWPCCHPVVFQCWQMDPLPRREIMHRHVLVSVEVCLGHYTVKDVVRQKHAEEIEWSSIVAGIVAPRCVRVWRQVASFSYLTFTTDLQSITILSFAPPVDRLALQHIPQTHTPHARSIGVCSGCGEGEAPVPKGARAQVSPVQPPPWLACAVRWGGGCSGRPGVILFPSWHIGTVKELGSTPLGHAV